MVTLILSPTVIQVNMTYSCSSLKGGPIPDAIMLSSDSEPGTPQKPVVMKVSSSDSEPGTPQKPVVMKVSSSDSEPGTPQKPVVMKVSSSDSEPGTPQKPVVMKVSSSDSEPGTPQKPVVTKVSSSDSEPETLQKHMVTNLSSDSENEPPHQPVEKAGLSYGSRYDWYRNQTLTCKAMMYIAVPVTISRVCLTTNVITPCHSVVVNRCGLYAVCCYILELNTLLLCCIAVMVCLGLDNMCVCVFACMCVCACACVCVLVCACMYVCVCVYILYVYVLVCMCARVCVRACVCVCMCAYMCMCMCILWCVTLYSDDGGESDADSELEGLQAMLGPHVPVYGAPRSGYTAHELASIVCEDVPEQKICTQKPTGVRTYASFVVDLKCINLKDLAADDNGVWVTSSPHRMYEVERKDGVICSLRHIPKVTSEIDKRNIITIHRQYGRHQATPEFRRIIATVVDSKGKTMPRAVVQYFFQGGKKVPVCVQPHGNSKGKERPYYRSQPSTLQAIKDRCKTNPASVAYSDIFEAAGGIDSCKSMSEEPRNKSQVSNACKSVKSESVEGKDEIFDLLYSTIKGTSIS